MAAVETADDAVDSGAPVEDEATTKDEPTVSTAALNHALNVSTQHQPRQSLNYQLDAQRCSQVTTGGEDRASLNNACID